MWWITLALMSSCTWAPTSRLVGEGGATALRPDPSAVQVVVKHSAQPFPVAHQVIPGDINWIVRRAAERGYPIPSAFMSSKPDAGINHKTYGVTSEGVQVGLLQCSLRASHHPWPLHRSPSRPH